jgi:hypothetical protein
MEFIPDLIVYHDPCDDGFAAAYVAKMRFPTPTCSRPTTATRYRSTG